MEEKEFNKMIITDTLSEIASEKMDGYLAHALCLEGKAEFDFSGKHFSFVGHDLLIIRKGELVTNLAFSEEVGTLIY